MRGVFDEQGLEPVRQSRDTEVTLGTGAILTIVLGLLLLCGICFGLGYAAGHRTPGSVAAPSPQPATDQEPLQASGNIPKPSAVAQTPVQPQANANDQNVATSANPAAPQAAIGAGAVSDPAPQPEVHAALPTLGTVPSTVSGTTQAVHPTQLQPQGPIYMVQIAAVSNPVDAEVLTNALKKRDYPVVSKREPADNFIHVRIGPFATRQIADQWRMKLLNDGYNAQVQP